MDSVFPAQEGHQAEAQNVSRQNVQIGGGSNARVQNARGERHSILVEERYFYL